MALVPKWGTDSKQAGDFPFLFFLASRPSRGRGAALPSGTSPRSGAARSPPLSRALSSGAPRRRGGSVGTRLSGGRPLPAPPGRALAAAGRGPAPAARRSRPQGPGGGSGAMWAGFPPLGAAAALLRGALRPGWAPAGGRQPLGSREERASRGNEAAEAAGAGGCALRGVAGSGARLGEGRCSRRRASMPAELEQVSAGLASRGRPGEPWAALTSWAFGRGFAAARCAHWWNARESQLLFSLTFSSCSVDLGTLWRRAPRNRAFGRGKLGYFAVRSVCFSQTVRCALWFCCWAYRGNNFYFLL